MILDGEVLFDAVTFMTWSKRGGPEIAFQTEHSVADYRGVSKNRRSDPFKRHQIMFFSCLDSPESPMTLEHIQRRNLHHSPRGPGPRFPL